MHPHRPPIGTDESTRGLLNDLLERAKNADTDAKNIEPGQLAAMVEGSTAMRSALDLGGAVT